MGDVNKYRKFLKELIHEEVKTDTKLERLKPRTDELGNFVMPKPRKKGIQSVSSGQATKNDTLRQDLERQSKISQTITEKRKELESGLTVVPIEQTKNTVQRIGDMIDMQDQARKNAKRLVNDPDEEQNIMTELLRRGTPDITLFNKVYPELFKFFEERTLITADEVMLQFDKIKRRINLQNVSDDFVFTRDTMATLVGDIMAQLSNVPPTPALIAAISTIETAVNAIETGNVDSRAKLDNITNALGNLSTDMQNMNPTNLANAVVQLSSTLSTPSTSSNMITQADMSTLVQDILTKLDNIPASPDLLNALGRIEGAVNLVEQSGASKRQIAKVVESLGKLSADVQTMNPTNLANAVVQLSISLPSQLAHAISSTSLPPDEMRGLVSSILTKLDNIPASPELLNALSRIEGAAGNPAMLSALKQLSIDIQSMNPNELKNAIVELSARIPETKDDQGIDEIDETDISDPIVAAYYRRMIGIADQGTSSETFEYVKSAMEDLIEKFKDDTQNDQPIKIAFNHEKGDKGATPFNHWGVVRKIFLDTNPSTNLNYKKAKDEFENKIIPAYESLNDVFNPPQKMSGSGIGRLPKKRSCKSKCGAGGGVSKVSDKDRSEITVDNAGKKWRRGNRIIPQSELNAEANARARYEVIRERPPHPIPAWQQRIIDGKKL